jgi:hypothetical protein
VCPARFRAHGVNLQQGLAVAPIGPVVLSSRLAVLFAGLALLL